MALLKRCSASSSVHTSSMASSGHASMHFGSPLQRSHAMAMPVSGWMTMPPCGQAWTHQSQPLHFLSFIMSMPVFSCWVRAFSGQAVMHLASSQARHVRAKLKRGIMWTVRMRERSGLVGSFFSMVQAYSHMPHPVHLLGSTLTNFLSANFCCGIVV